jgi:hypothetical protein
LIGNAVKIDLVAVVDVGRKDDEYDYVDNEPDLAGDLELGLRGL